MRTRWKKDRWTELLKPHIPDGAAHQKQMADLLFDVVCHTPGGDFAARALIFYPTDSRDSEKPGYRLKRLGDQLKGFISNLEAVKKDRNACRMLEGFGDDNWAALERLNSTLPRLP